MEVKPLVSEYNLICITMSNMHHIYDLMSSPCCNPANAYTEF